jgi:diguanylate cyclase (GGDEF)-like protein/PAS domain S-box-containing protein
VRSSDERGVVGRTSRSFLAGRDLALLALTTSCAVALVWFLADVADTRTQEVVYRLVQPPLDFALFVLARRVAKLPSAPAPMRRFWRALSIAGLLFTIGDTAHAFSGVAHPVAFWLSGAGVQGTTQAVGTLLPVWVMLWYPLGLKSGRERLRFWLDAAAVMVGAGVLAWYFSVSPHAAGRQPGEMLDSVANTGASLVAVFAVAKLLISGSGPFTRYPALVGAVAAGAHGLLDAIGPVLLATPYVNLPLAAKLLPGLLIAMTPRLQERQLRADPAVLDRRRVRRYSLLPYVMVAATQGLLIASLVRDGVGLRMWGVLAGVFGITGLVVARQLAAFSDNARMLDRLDASLVELGRHEQRFRSLVQNASEITVIADAHGVVTYASPALARILGVEPEDAVGAVAWERLHDDDRAAAGEVLGRLVQTPRATVTYQVRMRYADGSWRWLEMISTNLLDEPSVHGVVSNARDVTVARRLQDQLRHQASHDPLTRVANRSLFQERLQAAASAVEGDVASGGGRAGMLLIDLDDFKEINDTLGHHVGDLLLITCAQRLAGAVGPVDTVARLGGDEFAVLLPGAGPEEARRTAERIRACLAEPFLVEGRRVPFAASVGVAAGSVDAADRLLPAADADMYAANAASDPTASLSDLRRRRPSMVEEPRYAVATSAGGPISRNAPVSGPSGRITAVQSAIASVSSARSRPSGSGTQALAMPSTAYSTAAGAPRRRKLRSETGMLPVVCVAHRAASGTRANATRMRSACGSAAGPSSSANNRPTTIAVTAMERCRSSATAGRAASADRSAIRRSTRTSSLVRPTTEGSRGTRR